MTYIEFFDKTASENICACLSCAPERVVLVGDSKKVLERNAERYASLFSSRGINVEFICKNVSKNSLSDIVALFSQLVETYEDCVFDLTGGDDLYLVAVGIISEKYKDRQIQMHRFNIRKNTIFDCDHDGITISKNELPQLSVEENIRIYGGDVVYDDVKPFGTHRWNYDEQFRDEINAMWDICKNDAKLWNSQAVVLANAGACSEKTADPLCVSVSLQRLREHMATTSFSYVFDEAIMNSLSDSGLITDYSVRNGKLKFRYKNNQVKLCLTKAGQVLEMKIYSIAKDVSEKGNKIYNDVLNGVFIDWDGEIHPKNPELDVDNEIDVLAMKGMIPVFISCKNGTVKMEELYKLKSVAERFGGCYAKKVLVCSSSLKYGKNAKTFRIRAASMGITVVSGVQTMTDHELYERFLTLWDN